MLSVTQMETLALSTKALHNWSSRLQKSFLANKEHSICQNWCLRLLHSGNPCVRCSVVMLPAWKGSSYDWPILKLVKWWQFMWPVCSLTTVTCCDLCAAWWQSPVVTCVRPDDSHLLWPVWPDDSHLLWPVCGLMTVTCCDLCAAWWQSPVVTCVRPDDSHLLWLVCGLITVTCTDFDIGWQGLYLLLCRCCCNHLLGCHAFVMVLASMKGNTDKSRLICNHPLLQDYTFQILSAGKCQWTP